MPVGSAENAPDRERYARHLALPGFGEAGQTALVASRVLVVGAGGLGAAVIPYLAAAGVGRLGIVDDDVVELSNLQRQVIHTQDGVGTPKTESAAAAVTRLNSHVDVVTHRERVTSATVLALVADYDVVVDGSDNFTTRYVLNDACVALGVPLVWASISEFAGQLGVVIPGEGPCYRCLFPRPLGDDELPTCAIGGVLGVLPGVMGTLEATEVIKLLAGIGDVHPDAVVLYDALRTSFTSLPLRRDPECVACTGGELFVGLEDGAPGAVSVREVDAAQLRAAPRSVVDVREPHERAAAPSWALLARAGIEADELDVVAMPMSSWGPEEARTVAQASRERGVVMVCAGGVRSRRAARSVLGSDPSADVVSLRGGVDGLAGEAERDR